MRESEKRQTRGRILDVVRSVRWRWRTRIALRGLFITGAIAAAVFFLSAVGLEQARFSAQAVVWLRVLTWGTVVLSALFFLVRPLLRKVTDAQVALYLEEHEPTLEHAVTSVLDEGSGAASPELTQRVTEIALEKARAVEYGRRVEQSGLYRFTGALTALGVLAVAATLLGPTSLRHGLSALLFPTTEAAAVNPYFVTVDPGDVTIARGTDQVVTAQLGGFDAAEASIFTKGESEDEFQRLSMLPGLETGFEVMLLGVPEATEYFVESSGVRSPTFTIDVADLPYVEQIDLTYYFPGYTGLQPRVVEDGGDVAALSGSTVEVTIAPTMLTPAGRLLVDGEPIELTVNDDGGLTGRFPVREDGFYSVELARADNGELVPASPEYRIDVLSDLPPSINFSTPGRDMPASAIEEVYLEMAADDDYGIGDVRLVFSINGAEEDTISVFRGSGAPLSEVSVGHTLFLEEWELEVGDLISYYAVARDNRMGAAGEVTSDIYFLNIRPFERAYREAEQQGGGGQPGQGGAETALSDMQRQIIAATFNLIRQQDSYDPQEFSENVNSVAMSQQRLQDQIVTLLQRMQNRGLTQTDPGFRDVSAVLPLADSAMTAARRALEAEDLRDAMPHEQTALRYLQQAEETYERYVQQGQQQGGGGGGGGQQAAEDLADLFELELDKMKNQYETVQRGQQQQSDNQVDELMEELRELARRQEQQAERQRRAQQNQGAASSNGDAQRALADETEEAARQLQRLAREMGDRDLEETARDLQEAADAMRQSASSSGSQATSDANSALRRLEDARRQLQDSRSERARRDAEQAIQQVEELQQQQREIQRDVRELPTERNAERAQAIQQLRERKDQMHEVVQDLERQLNDAASNGQADNPTAARELANSANFISESKLKEKIQYTRGTIEQWDPQSAVTMELQIEGDLQELRDRLEGAREASAAPEDNPLRDALDDTRDLVRGMEAMDRRLNEPGQGQQGQGQDGQQGQGQQGQEGQDGQQGQGQQGQEGQQGQQGQGEQGQEGQQGQGQGGQQGQQGGNQQGNGGAGDALVGERYAGSPFGGATRGSPREFSPEEIRQFISEFGERSDQLQDLRSDLRNAGQNTDDLDSVLQTLQRFQDEDLFADPEALASLHDDMLTRLKRVEFGLRRDVEGEAERRATLNGADEVPDGYRGLVEEYYRALARSGGNRPGGN